jgi:F-type H+-transporting ATPase subunit b
MNINVTLFAQAIAFVLFIWFSKVVVWPGLMARVDARTKRIADGLAAAEEGKQALANSAKQVAEELNTARNRAAEIISTAEKRALQMIEEATVAETEAQNRVKAAAKAEIEQEAARAREALRDQVAALAVAGAEKILRREVNAQAHAELLTQLKQDLA